MPFLMNRITLNNRAGSDIVYASNIVNEYTSIGLRYSEGRKRDGEIARMVERAKTSIINGARSLSLRGYVCTYWNC